MCSSNIKKYETAKLECSQHIDSTIKFKSYVPSSYFIKSSASVKISNTAAAEDVTANVPEFIRNLKSGKFYPVGYGHYLKFVLFNELDELSYSETVQIMEDIFGQNSSFSIAYFKYLKLVNWHDKSSYDFDGVMKFHCD
ncbi:unnamed protein product [Hymenolepis diminuta]|uniref:Uncharacterized protein n=1 Tax=Hymenolepis diminuta TaxID=6216 RepID=A0A564Z2W2_HYMDI|nr:unnamed protein product [Hymenolepis diminuta]